MRLRTFFDGIIPVIPAAATNWDNALTLTASFVRGQAIADLFTGLTGGVGLTLLPADSTGKASSFYIFYSPSLSHFHRVLASMPSFSAALPLWPPSWVKAQAA